MELSAYYFKGLTARMHKPKSHIIYVPLLLPPGDPRWLQDVQTEVELEHAQPLCETRCLKFYQIVQPIIDGPVKLVWLVTGQDKHKPAASSKGVSVNKMSSSSEINAPTYIRIRTSYMYTCN